MALLALLTVAVAAPAAAGAAPRFVRPSALREGGVPRGSVRLGGVPSHEQVQLSIVLPPSNSAGLEQLIAGLYDPSSGEFHQWLKPGQFMSEFGPSPTAVSGVESWLRGQGLTGKLSGFSVLVSAPAATVASGLGVSLERYRAPGGHEGYMSNEAPLVPAALSTGQIAAVIGLNTVVQYHPVGNATTVKPSLDGSGTPAAHADGLTACAAAQNEAAPGYYTLDALGADYGVGDLVTNGQDGHGETIGLYELASHSPTDVQAYASCFGLTNSVSTQQVEGGGGPIGGGGTGEADLDIEQAMTQAPDASIIAYEGPNSPIGEYEAWSKIINADAAQVLSTSWGLCEPFAKQDDDIPALSTLFAQAATQGQTVVAAMGDSGSEDCYPANGSTEEEVDYPASDPLVTAAGGTFRYGDGTEVAWNYCQGDESTACADDEGGAGGGGMSRYEARPSYQPNFMSWPTAQSCGLDCREVPDISANAGAGMVIYDNGSWDVGAGTSFDAPLIAAIVADKNDGCSTTSGVFTTGLYGLYDQGAYGTAFSDITSGDNDMTGSNGGAYAAGTGYDLATGIGTPLAGGFACPDVTSVGAGTPGADVTVTGTGLSGATITFGATAATVVSATATSATVVVPPGSGAETVSASDPMGTGTGTAAFSYGGSSSGGNGQHGYWLVGADGGIFSFGSAQFQGSMGNVKLQRPVVGITPTADRGGYRLVASDGGIFSFGDATFYGSIPGDGLAPAGTPGTTKRLNAPIVGMVPSSDGAGYFLVGADGGVFAFGDAHFAGSCPARPGGCSGAAVAVMPDASGAGYWLVTATGHVYAFGDAVNYGSPGQQSVPVTSAVRTPDGNGYWILFSNGVVAAYGDAPALGGPLGAVGGSDPATSIFTTSDGGGYWVASAKGVVYDYGDAPNDGDLAGTRLNAPIIAASGS